jgi:hypothetical protein
MLPDRPIAPRFLFFYCLLNSFNRGAISFWGFGGEASKMLLDLPVGHHYIALTVKVIHNMWIIVALFYCSTILFLFLFHLDFVMCYQ